MTMLIMLHTGVARMVNTAHPDVHIPVNTDEEQVDIHCLNHGVIPYCSPCFSDSHHLRTVLFLLPTVQKWPNPGHNLHGSTHF